MCEFDSHSEQQSLSMILIFLMLDIAVTLSKMQLQSRQKFINPLKNFLKIVN